MKKRIDPWNIALVLLILACVIGGVLAHQRSIREKRSKELIPSEIVWEPLVPQPLVFVTKDDGAKYCEIIDRNIFMNDRDEYYVHLPVIAVLQELGCAVQWETEETARITIKGKDYIFDLAACTICEEGSDIDLVIDYGSCSVQRSTVTIPGLDRYFIQEQAKQYGWNEKQTEYLTAAERRPEFYMDNCSLTLTLLYHCGMEIDIDYDAENNIVLIKNGSGNGLLSQSWKEAWAAENGTD